jgi:hypothetical protein
VVCAGVGRPPGHRRSSLRVGTLRAWDGTPFSGQGPEEGVSVSDTSIPLDDLDQPDPDTNRARRMLADPPLSKETLYRLGRRGEIAGYLLGGRRLWTLASLRAYRERCTKRGRNLRRSLGLASVDRGVLVKMSSPLHPPAPGDQPWRRAPSTRWSIVSSQNTTTICATSRRRSYRGLRWAALGGDWRRS